MLWLHLWYLWWYPSVKDSEGLWRASVAPVVLSSVEVTTPLHKKWPNSGLQAKKISSGDSSLQAGLLSVIGRPKTEQCMDHLQTTLKEADQCILTHVLDCVQAGYGTCIVISIDTDVIIALLYYVRVFHKEGLKELWVWAGKDNTAHFVPLHVIHSWHGNDLCKVLSALHSLTGCDSDINSKIGSKKAALEDSARWLKLALSRFSMQNATWML